MDRPLSHAGREHPRLPDPRPLRQALYEYGDTALHYGLTLDEHTGTHMDAPLHFIPGGAATDEIPPGRLAGRAATIEATDLGAGDLLGVDRIEAWEEANGSIEAGDRVLIRYGWDLNLHRLPPFCLFLALPLKLKGGSGSPVRAVALVPR